MITDAECNYLYLADTLPTMYPDFYGKLLKAIEHLNIPLMPLLGTKDVWAKDFMPIQIAPVQLVNLDEVAESNEQLLVYPNPTTGMVSFITENGYEAINIFNSLGKIVYSAKGNYDNKLQSIDLSNLASGIYFLNIKAGLNTWTGKIIVVH